MSKTVQIEVVSPKHGYFPGDMIRIDVSNFCSVARQMASEAVSFAGGACGIPHPWFAAALFAVNDKGLVELTPRGEDLLASAHLIPEGKAPESAKPSERESCSACDGGGTETLFAYAKPCPRCEGSTFEPDIIIHDEVDCGVASVDVAAVEYGRPIIIPGEGRLDPVEGYGWIYTEQMARSFIGQNIEILKLIEEK